MRIALLRKFCVAAMAVALLGPLCGSMYATTLTPATGGLALVSYGTGALGVGGAVAGGFGGGWKSFFGGVASVGLILVDPPSGDFYSGTFVLEYPDTLLAPVAVGWFGNFAANPSSPTPPVMSTGYVNLPGGTYDWFQAANPAIHATVTNDTSNPLVGVLTVTFSDPDGVPAQTGVDFNMFNMQLQNISGQTLLWKINTTGGGNLFQNAAAQSSMCIPDPLFYANPITCGDDGSTSFHYDVSRVPEPSSLLMMFTGLVGLAGMGGTRKSWMRAHFPGLAAPEK